MTSVRGSGGTPGRRSESPPVMVGFAAAWVMLLCLIWFGTSEAAQDSLVNCNEVIIQDRCACNERVLRAFTQSRPLFLDPTEGGNPGEAKAALAIQQQRYELLRTFHAPDCAKPSSPDRLPLSQPHITNRLYGGRAIEDSLQPLRTKLISPKEQDFSAAWKLLAGRWEGWQTLFGGKPSPVSFHVISVGLPLPLSTPGAAPFVKACSDQGMVFGRLRDGYLELPRSDSFGLAYSIRLWESTAPMHSRDLEGVVLLEVRPGEVLVAGVISLSRALKFDWTAPPSSYFCQDRDLEEQRKNVREQQ